MHPALSSPANAFLGEDRALAAQERLGIPRIGIPDLEILSSEVLGGVDERLEAMRQGSIPPVAHDEYQPGVRVNIV